MKPRLLAAVVIAILAAACAQTPTGSPPATRTPPPPTQTVPPTNGAVAYDMARKVVVLVTPHPSQTATVMETWTWDGRLWTRQRPAISPPVSVGALLAYDESRRVAVLAGGVAGRQIMTDTWEWDGSNWSPRSPIHTPNLQQSVSMAYDPSTHRTVLFLSDRQTWTWDGRDWTAVQSAHVPDLFQGDLVFDGKRLILFGGSVNGNGLETWGWSGTDWTLLAAGPAPDVLPLMPYAFDSARSKVIIYGGGSGDDSWTWDGTKWSREHPKHSPAGDLPHLINDPALNSVIGFAGTDYGAIAGIYAWNGSDWSALGPGSPPAVAAGRNLLPGVDAEAIIRRTVTNTHPVLLPRLPAGVNQAMVTADPNGFSLRVMNDDRSIQITISIAVPGNSNLGATGGTIVFRRGSAFYQYIAGDPTGWRDLWWTERPGYWASSSNPTDRSSVPYVLSATGLSEADFFALAGSLN